ncbi:MAG TPA: hypothetical protein VIG90_04610 [Pedomonas sp.]|uniref:hypothetical protein n=1 Tax=Pedomonas sp. TaxID=2976421 RepID=UPI002F42485B
MAIDGLWKLNITSPLGPMESELSVTSSDGALTGVQRAAGDERAIYNGSVDGNAVVWSVDITQPMPITLIFKGSMDGDRLSGQAQAGSFGAFPFEGTRSA